MQLSLIPDLVPAKALPKKQAGKQLTLNILGTVAPAPVVTEKKKPLTAPDEWFIAMS